MLQMTDRAVDLLRNLRNDAQLPESAGVRVYSETAATGVWNLPSEEMPSS